MKVTGAQSRGSLQNFLHNIYSTILNADSGVFYTGTFFVVTWELRGFGIISMHLRQAGLISPGCTVRELKSMKLTELCPSEEQNIVSKIFRKVAECGSLSGISGISHTLLKRTFRESDIISRIGEDEFSVLLISV